MKKENSNPADEKLGALLRDARPPPPLPPRFQQNVWRRLEDSKLPASQESGMAALVALVLRPRLAFAFAAVLVLAGGMMGARVGVQTARHDAEARYVASVAPNSVR